MELDFFFLLSQRENIVSIDLINLASPHCFKKRSLGERKKNRLIINQKRPLPVFPQIYSLRVFRITIAQNNDDETNDNLTYNNAI